MARPRLRQLALAAATAGVGAAAGALAAAAELNRPPRTDLAYQFSPFEVGAEATSVRYTSSDDVPLAAWWFERPESERVVIVSHGYGGSKADMLGIGPGLWRAGNSVLVHDFRGSGESGDGPQSLGHYEQRDLEAAIDWVAAKRPDAEICLVGFSMGAAVSLMVAARDTRVAKVVADSPFADMRGVVANAARTRHLPVPLVALVDHATGLRYGYRFGQVQPIDVVAALAARPLLLIACTEDEVIPVDHARRLHDAAPGSELVVVEGGYHCAAYFLDRPAYVAMVAGFLDGSRLTAHEPEHRRAH